MSSSSSISTTSLNDHRQQSYSHQNWVNTPPRAMGRRQSILERKVSRQITNPSLARSVSRDSLSSQSTEADVCFPMAQDHTRIDFNLLDQFIAQERQERQQQKYAPSIASSSNIPSRFSFVKGNNDTIHAPELSLLVPPGKSFQSLFGGDPTQPWWMDCTCANDDEMKTIARAFGMHPLTAEDIRLQEPREKVELFRNYYFVCFHSFEQDSESEEYLDPINVYIVVFAEGVLSFHYSPVSHPASVRRRIRQLSDYVHVSADWICYAIIDDIVDAFIPVIDGIEYEADAIEDNVFVLRNTDFTAMLARIGESRRKVMLLMRLLANKADVIKMFAKRYQEKQVVWHKDQLSMHRGEIALYLGDIQDHVLTMFQNLNSYEKIFSRSHSNYLAQVQVLSVDANKKLNKLFSKVALIGTILVPLNLVTGLFGMNVTVPGQETGKLNWWFSIMAFVLGVIIILWGLGVTWFKWEERRGLLDRGSSESVPRRILRRGVVAEVRSIMSSWTNDS